MSTRKPAFFGSRLYRDGHLIDVRLSDTRDLTAAETFCRSAWTVIGVTPEHITTDRDDAYPRAIRNVFGDQVIHRTNRYLNDHLEQDHRGIKQRYRSMGGFKADTTAVHFCGLFDELRSFDPNHVATNHSPSRSDGIAIRRGSSS